ncbi:MAG: type II secretion system protein GspG [Verrucomicrobiota bacterium]
MRHNSGKLSQVDAAFKTFDSALTLYKSNAGSFPTTEQGLKVLVEKPSTTPFPHRWSQTVKKLPLDPWGADYDYRFPGSKDPTTPEIICRGEDGVANTADDLSSQHE